MKLFTVFVSFAPPPRDVIVVIIPYKEEAEQMKLFTFFVSFAPPLPPILKLFVCFVSFAPPLPPILTHIVTHEEKKYDFGFRSREAEIYPKIDFSRN